MSRQLQIASKVEMRAVIRFLWAKRFNCTEIYGQFHEVYGENAMSRQAIAKWCNIFENGRTYIDDAEREGNCGITLLIAQIFHLLTSMCLAQWNKNFHSDGTIRMPKWKLQPSKGYRTLDGISLPKASKNLYHASTNI